MSPFQRYIRKPVPKQKVLSAVDEGVTAGLSRDFRFLFYLEMAVSGSRQFASTLEIHIEQMNEIVIS